ncbi:MAG: 8-oxo-dGTP diphosphatase [Patescibacteria group bacterium]|nr:8-oxo-dGTP diphosphatase [Patescibacteria group bacterium]
MALSKKNISKQTLTLTLALVREDGRLLLGRKKRGFGEGKWNGFGGKVESGESIEEAARRELMEEAGIAVDQMFAVGRLTFTFEGNDPELDVHVFEGRVITGEPSESEEMRPKWFDEDVIPFDEMWVDDELWLPLFLAGKRFAGSFHFVDHDTIAHHSLIVIEGCPVCGARDCPPGTHVEKAPKSRVAKIEALD